MCGLFLVESGGSSLVVVHGLLIVVASLVDYWCGAWALVVVARGLRSCVSRLWNTLSIV